MNNPSKEIIVVAITTDQSNEEKISQFYEGNFLPNLLEVLPEIRTAKRYLKLQPTHDNLVTTWTLYEIDENSRAESVVQAIATRPGREKQLISPLSILPLLVSNPV